VYYQELGVELMEEIERIFGMLNLQKTFWAILIFWNPLKKSVGYRRVNLRSFSADYFHNIKIIGHLNVS